jgi:hypothetical protein
MMNGKRVEESCVRLVAGAVLTIVLEQLRETRNKLAIFDVQTAALSLVGCDAVWLICGTRRFYPTCCFHAQE